MPSNLGHIELPPTSTSLVVSKKFFRSYLHTLPLEKNILIQYQREFSDVLKAVIKQNKNNQSEKQIQIDFRKEKKNVTVSVLNQGVPLFLETLPPALRDNHRIKLKNLGRKGQRIYFKIRRAHPKEKSSPQLTQKAVEPSTQKLTVRLLKPGEEPCLSELFYRVYGYQYVNDFVYYPAQIKERLKDGRLISVVTDCNGKLIGHVGLLQLNHSPFVYEACLAVVDPAVKSRGLFSEMFHQIMEKVKTTPMSYCVFDCVTNIDFTQRLVQSYGGSDLALFVGYQTAKTQARLEKLGIGPDPKNMDRYSLLCSVLPCVKHPFGSEVVLPDNLGNLLGFLLSPLGMSWVPASRFSPLPPQGRYTITEHPEQKSLIFDFVEPGRKALHDLVNHWGVLLRNGYQFAAVDIPLTTYGLSTIHDTLASSGFFVSGFIPYHFSSGLACRFQAIAPTQVALDKIKVFSPTAKRLLEIIRQDYERNLLQ